MVPFPALNANVLQHQKSWTLIIKSTWPFQIAIDESLGRKIPWFSLEGPACPAWRMWWWWSLRQKLQRNSRNYTGTWLFPADISGAQTRINIQFAPLFLGSRLFQQLGTSKGQIKGGNGWSFFRGNWLSEALFKMAGIQKEGLFWCAVECEGLASCVAPRLIFCPPVSELHNTAAMPWNAAGSWVLSRQRAAGLPSPHTSSKDNCHTFATWFCFGSGFYFTHIFTCSAFFLYSHSRQIRYN